MLIYFIWSSTHRKNLRNELQVKLKESRKKTVTNRRAEIENKHVLQANNKAKLGSLKRLIKLISAKQDPMGIEKILTEHYKQLYANRIWQFRWSTQTIKIYLTKMKQEKIKHLNTSISIKEIESVINIPPKKSPGPDIFTGKGFQAFKQEILGLHNLF